MALFIAAVLLFLVFYVYRKYSAERVLREAKRKYEFSIWNGNRYEIGKARVKIGAGRTYFLENEILNFDKKLLVEIEQVVVPDLGIQRRKGVLKGNYYELYDLKITEGKTEIFCATPHTRTTVITLATNGKEEVALRKWRERYFGESKHGPERIRSDE